MNEPEEEERLSSGRPAEDDVVLDNTLRPPTLEDYPFILRGSKGAIGGSGGGFDMARAATGWLSWLSNSAPSPT